MITNMHAQYKYTHVCAVVCKVKPITLYVLYKHIQTKPDSLNAVSFCTKFTYCLRYTYVMPYSYICECTHTVIGVHDCTVPTCIGSRKLHGDIQYDKILIFFKIIFNLIFDVATDNYFSTLCNSRYSIW